MDETESELSREELLNRYKKTADRPSEGLARRSPFKFLDSYDVGDSDIFFGRDREIEELLQLYHTMGHILIYGESGSGKTSLVQCGLRARIPEADALFIPMRIRAEGLPGVCRDICLYASQQLGETVEYDPEMTLTDALGEAREAASRPIVLFFDQFEELLIFQDADGRRLFAAELAKIRKAKINVKVIIGIRQDFLAQLTELEDVLEGLFDNRFWLRRMSRENAAQAVVKACATCDVKIDVNLADSIIQRLDTTGQGIELPYLQVVMDRLYRQAVEANPNQPVISSNDVEKLGDVAQILGAFLIDEVEKLPSPEAGRQVLKAFVSREGTRRRLTREAVSQEAAGFGGEIAPADLDAILSQLVKVRILREDVDAGLFELRHDSLAATIFSWISKVEKELIEVRDNLVNRFNEYQARTHAKSALLDQGFMDYVSVYKHRLKPLLNQDQREYLTLSEHELGRRRRIRQLSIFGSIAAVILVAFLFLFSEMNKAKRLAEAERQRFEEARKTVDQFFVTVSEDTLLNQPGMQDLRLKLLSDAGEYFKTYLANDLQKEGNRSKDDSLNSQDQLHADLARTNYYLGQLTELVDGHEAGLAYFEKADEDQKELVKKNPKNSTLLFDFGNTLNAMGWAYDQLGSHRDQAKDRYEQALKRRKDLTDRFPLEPASNLSVEQICEAAEYKRKYANTLMNFAQLARDEGLDNTDPQLCKSVIKNFEEANSERIRIESILKELQPVAPQDKRIIRETRFKNLRDLAQGYVNLAAFYQAIGNDKELRNKPDFLDKPAWESAVDYYENALNQCELADQQVPDVLDVRFARGESYVGLGYVYKSPKKNAENSYLATEPGIEPEKRSYFYKVYEDRYENQENNLKQAKDIIGDLLKNNPLVIDYQLTFGKAELFLGKACYDWHNRLKKEAERLIAEGNNDAASKSQAMAKEKLVIARSSLENANRVLEPCNGSEDLLSDVAAQLIKVEASESE